MFILIDGIYIVLCLVYTHLSNLRKAFLCVVSLAFCLILLARFSSVWFKLVRIREVNSIFTLITWLGGLSEFYKDLRARARMHTHTHTQKYVCKYVRACFINSFFLRYLTRFFSS